jgi:hypothetical protein
LGHLTGFSAAPGARAATVFRPGFSRAQKSSYHLRQTSHEPVVAGEDLQVALDPLGDEVWSPGITTRAMLAMPLLYSNRQSRSMTG